MRILIVEDSNCMREAILRRLRATGFAADEAPDLASATALLQVYGHSVIVLDRMLPDGDGLAWLQARRRDGLRVPVLVLTALGDVEERVEGLVAGADDYLAKPFAMEELLARVTALSRRGAQPTPSVLTGADIELDTGRREVRRAGVLIPLRAKEYAVLALLMGQQGTVVSRATILESCWDQSTDPLSNVEEVIVAALRRKLGSPPVIHTRRGMGYQFDA